MKIREVIVVEGQNDINKIQSCIEADCLKTNGTHLSKKFLQQLVEINNVRGVIVMTDDDYPGRWIRTQIQEHLKNCKHAYIDKKVSSTKRKVGIEHATCETIQKALKDIVHYETESETLSYTEYISCGFISGQSTELRQQVLKHLGLPTMNNKRLFKTLNMMKITKEELERIVHANHQ